LCIKLASLIIWGVRIYFSRFVGGLHELRLVIATKHYNATSPLALCLVSRVVSSDLIVDSRYVHCSCGEELNVSLLEYISSLFHVVVLSGSGSIWSSMDWVRSKLGDASTTFVAFWTILTGMIAYFCVYCIRVPLFVATFSGHTALGIDLKDGFALAQV